MIQNQSQFIDLYKASMRTAVDVTKVALENVERMQNRQLQLVRSALEDSARSASQLGEAKSLDELMTMQSRLAGAQMERAMDFWTTMWRSAADSAASQAQNVASGLRDVAREAGRDAVQGQSRPHERHERKSA